MIPNRSRRDGEKAFAGGRKIPTLRLRSGQAFSRTKRARNGAPGWKRWSRQGMGRL